MFKRSFLKGLIVMLSIMFTGCDISTDCYISGRVVDENGVGLSGVTVTLSGDLSRTTTTDSNGYYSFGDLSEDDIIPAGSYTVTPSYSDLHFSPANKNVTITTGTRPVRQIDFKSIASAMTPEEVVRAWNEAFSNQDIDAALKLMSDDFVRLGDSTNWQPMPKNIWGRSMKNFMAAFPDWTWKLNSLTTQGDLVACEFTEHGTFTEPFRIMPGLTIQPTGESYTDENADFFRVNEDGLITEIRAYITNNFERTYHIASQIEAFLAGQ